MKRYETVRFNWYHQCRVPCYAILENSLKMFKSSCLTAQENLQKRQFFGLSRQVETRIPPYFTRPKSEKIWPLFCRNLQLDPPCGITCGGGGREEGGGSNPIDPFTSTPSGLRWYKKMVDWFNKKWLYSRLRFFFEATITTNNRSPYFDVICWRQRPSFTAQTNEVINQQSQRRHTSGIRLILYRYLFATAVKVCDKTFSIIWSPW